MEIVFISSDSDLPAFEEYYGEMPWVSVPFEARDVAQRLGQKFEVRGIPAFLVFNPNGEIIDKDGRATVAGARGNTNKALGKWHATL
jgi:nucleoredoxin